MRSACAGARIKDHRTLVSEGRLTTSEYSRRPQVVLLHLYSIPSCDAYGGGGGGGGQQVSCLVAKQAVEYPQVLASRLIICTHLMILRMWRDVKTPHPTHSWGALSVSPLP